MDYPALPGGLLMLRFIEGISRQVNAMGDSKALPNLARHEVPVIRIHSTAPDGL